MLDIDAAHAACNPLTTWDSNHVQAWLAEQPALRLQHQLLQVDGIDTGTCCQSNLLRSTYIYGRCVEPSSHMQGVTGPELAALTDKDLLSRGVTSRLQRVQLLNRRDELLLLMSEDSEDAQPDIQSAIVSTSQVCFSIHLLLRPAITDALVDRCAPYVHVLWHRVRR